MKLRDHPLVHWPPAWLWRYGSDDTSPVGEVGLLKDVILSGVEPRDRCFLVMQHMGAEYIGCLSFQDSAFCSEIYEVLGNYCGNLIHDIGDMEISFAPMEQITGRDDVI
jgi:hypothetical protein